jgi:putative NADH-flavin reductase
MRVTVIGAAGRTGRQVVEQARRRGHEVVAVVRDPARAPDADAVAVVRDGRDAEALRGAIDGSDVVVFAIGPVRGEDDPVVMRECAAALVDAARGAGPSRAVFVSASGPFTDAGDDFLTRRVAKPILQRVLRQAFDDLRATEAVVRGSHLDWTIVRPPMLTDAAPRGRYRRSTVANVRGGTRIARGDLATAVVDSVEDPTLVGTTLSVAR